MKMKRIRLSSPGGSLNGKLCATGSASKNRVGKSVALLVVICHCLTEMLCIAGSAGAAQMRQQPVRVDICLNTARINTAAADDQVF